MGASWEARECFTEFISESTLSGAITIQVYFSGPLPAPWVPRALSTRLSHDPNTFGPVSTAVTGLGLLAPETCG